MCEGRSSRGRGPEGTARGMSGKSQEPQEAVIRDEGSCKGWKELSGEES